MSCRSRRDGRGREVVEKFRCSDRGQGLLTRRVDPATLVKSNRRLDKKKESNDVHLVITFLFFHMRDIILHPTYLRVQFVLFLLAALQASVLIFIFLTYKDHSGSDKPSKFHPLATAHYLANDGETCEHQGNHAGWAIHYFAPFNLFVKFCHD